MQASKLQTNGVNRCYLAAKWATFLAVRYGNTNTKISIYLFVFWIHEIAKSVIQSCHHGLSSILITNHCYLGWPWFTLYSLGLLGGQVVKALDWPRGPRFQLHYSYRDFFSPKRLLSSAQKC